MRISKENMRYETAIYLIHHHRFIKGMCEVEFDDKIVSLPIRAVILHLPYWEMYTRVGLPVTSDKVYFDGPPYNDEVYKKIMTDFYEECFSKNFTREQIDEMTTQMWFCINNIQDFGVHELGEYIVGVSIIGLSELTETPEVKELAATEFPEESMNLSQKQDLIKEQEKILMKHLQDPHFLPGNDLYPFASIKALKTSQVAQVMLRDGYKSEITDYLFKYLIKSNFINGMRSFADLVFENCSARKNVYYSHDAIKMSQYFNREISLLASSIAHLYPGSCGTDVTLSIELSEELAPHCYGKFFYLEDDCTQAEHCLTEKNASKYIGKKIQMYSAITCRHTNGVCERCMGLLARNHTPEINIGMTAASNFVSSVSQLILSIKHLDSANPVIYVIPEEASEWLTISEQGIRIQPSKTKLFDRIELGFYFADINMSKGDMQHFNPELNVPENKFSEIKSILIRDTKTSETREFNLMYDEMVPFLTKDFILYWHEYQKECKEDENVVWIPLAFMSKKTMPILRSLVYNNSMMVYVTHLTERFRKAVLSKYHDASKALQDFAYFIFDKVTSVNIFQVEILLKAHSVVNNMNYSIPVVTDPYDVNFGRTKELLANRTITGQLAHEGHKGHFADSLTYVTLKDQSQFDAMANV